MTPPTTPDISTTSSNHASPFVAAGTDRIFVERRQDDERIGPSERRQFGNSHKDLSHDGRELAIAIDRYKLANHRRYLTCDEMLTVIQDLGYAKSV